jgi:predicted aldo/keto reductase-like oxidoreductase
MERKAAITLIRQAVESGVTLFDTAEAYGSNEEIVAEPSATSAMSAPVLEKCPSLTYSTTGYILRGAKRNPDANRWPSLCR